MYTRDEGFLGAPAPALQLVPVHKVQRAQPKYCSLGPCHGAATHFWDISGAPELAKLWHGHTEVTSTNIFSENSSHLVVKNESSLLLPGPWISVPYLPRCCTQTLLMPAGAAAHHSGQFTLSLGAQGEERLWRVHPPGCYASPGTSAGKGPGLPCKHAVGPAACCTM